MLPSIIKKACINLEKSITALAFFEQLLRKVHCLVTQIP